VKNLEQSVCSWRPEWHWEPIDWTANKFPAPSHILDASLRMLGVQSGFGEPVRAGWPRLPKELRSVPRHPKPWFDSELLLGLRYSGERLLIGFVISMGAGAALGMLMWRVEGVDKFIGPLFLGLQTLPSVCWVPLAVLVFGINETGILFVLVMGSFSAAALSLRDGLRTIPPLYPRAGAMLGARGWKLYRYVLLPASLPALAGSLRTGFSFAWRSLMGAELIFFVERRGLGFLLQTGRDFSDIAQVVAVMVIMVGIGMLADRWLFAVLQRRVQARFGLA
jgi:NitT/TauT family transport system permease protein